MKHLSIILAATVLISFSAIAQTPSNLDSFNTKAKKLGLKFHMPINFKEIKTKTNKQLYYIFAIKNDIANFEVRYSLSTISEKDKKRYKECLTDPNCSSVNPNNLFKSIMMANIMNMTGGKISRVDTVKSPKMFAADKVIVSPYFDFDCEFGEGYKYGRILAIQKNDVGFAFIVFMANDKEEMKKT